MEDVQVFYSILSEIEDNSKILQDIYQCLSTIMENQVTNLILDKYVTFFAISFCILIFLVTAILVIKYV